MPLAEHDVFVLRNKFDLQVSIHVPLAEHDITAAHYYGYEFVSIHVPLAEHDAPNADSTRSEAGFNSRAPRGARP